MKLPLRSCFTFLAACFLAAPALAKVGADEAARLGAALTPVGAEKGANKDGSIPAWTPAARRGELKGEYPTNPAYDKEKPLYTITAANYASYVDKLSEGHKKLFASYDSYKMNVYPSHRPVSYPEFIYTSTRENATRCELLGIDSPSHCKVGFPFPIPKSGAEVIWNHRLKYRGDGARRWNNQMIVQLDGSFQLTKILEDVTFSYATEKDPVALEDGSGLFLKYLSKTMAPPRLAGTMILVHERAGAGNDGRQAWLYAPALKRVRRAPTVCCDNPYEGTDGHQFYDQVDMFNGVLERYDWKLLGKKEMLIPYNGNRIAGPSVKYADLARPRHLNQDLPRYELHRVWVVEATIREGTSHTFSKRRFYVDEDSWYIAMGDMYDRQGQIQQFQEGHAVFGYNVQSVGGSPEVIYHFNSGRYFLTAMANEEKPNDFSVRFPDSHFESTALQKKSTK